MKRLLLALILAVGTIYAANTPINNLVLTGTSSENSGTLTVQSGAGVAFPSGSVLTLNGLHVNITSSPVNGTVLTYVAANGDLELAALPAGGIGNIGINTTFGPTQIGFLTANGNLTLTGNILSANLSGNIPTLITNNITTLLGASETAGNWNYTGNLGVAGGNSLFYPLDVKGNAKIGSYQNQGQGLFYGVGFTNTSDNKNYAFVSNDGVTFNNLGALPIVTTGGNGTGGSPTARNPAIINYNNQYYMELGGSANTSFLDVYTSPDLTNWTLSANLNFASLIPGTAQAWSANWFVDTSNLLHLIFCASPTLFNGTNPQNFSIYEMNFPNGNLAAPSTPVQLTGTGLPSCMVDPFIVQTGSTFNLFYSNQTANNPNHYLELATSSSLTSGYAVAVSGNGYGFGGPMEAPRLVQISATDWRVYTDSNGAGIYYADSTNNFSSFNAKALISSPYTLVAPDVIRFTDISSLRNIEAQFIQTNPIQVITSSGNLSITPPGGNLTVNGNYTLTGNNANSPVSTIIDTSAGSGPIADVALVSNLPSGDAAYRGIGTALSTGNMIFMGYGNSSTSGLREGFLALEGVPAAFQTFFNGTTDIGSSGNVTNILGTSNTTGASTFGSTVTASGLITANAGASIAANNTVTILSGNTSGNATMVAGQVFVSTTAVTNGCVIIPTSIGDLGIPGITNVTVGQGFNITSNITDNSTVDWKIIK